MTKVCFEGDYEVTRLAAWGRSKHGRVDHKPFVGLVTSKDGV